MGQMLVDTSDPLRVLLYGEGGSGKTTALMGMAHLGKILVINAEKGVKAKALKKRGIPVENIEVFPGDGEELTFASLQAEIERVKDAIAKDPTAYVGVVWDSATEILSTLLDEAVLLGYQKAQRLGKTRDRYFVDLADYGTVTTQLRALIRDCMDLPCHFGVSALAKREQDDDGTVAYVISVTPAFRKDLIGWVDMVGFCDTVTLDDTDIYRALFRPRGKYYGKDRLSATPPRLMDPSFDRLLAYVDGDMDVDSDPVMGRIRRLLDEAAKKATPASTEKTTTTPKEK